MSCPLNPTPSFPRAMSASILSPARSSGNSWNEASNSTSFASVSELFVCVGDKRTESILRPDWTGEINAHQHHFRVSPDRFEGSSDTLRACAINHGDPGRLARSIAPTMRDRMLANTGRSHRGERRPLKTQHCGYSRLWRPSEQWQMVELSCHFIPQKAFWPVCSWDPIVKYIKDQHSAYLRKELTAQRERYIQDTRVHCCLFFIQPSGHACVSEPSQWPCGRSG